MGNKKDVAAVELSASTAKLIVDGDHPRRCVRIRTNSVAVELYRRDPTGISVPLIPWPLSANSEFFDEHSTDDFWALASAATSVRVLVIE